MYHRITENTAGAPAATLNVTPAQLRRQLVGLLARGFESWPLSKLVAARRAARPVPGNVFAVSFDDGYENNYLNAWPILRELKVHATIFLATKYLDTNEPFPFDDWPAAGSDRVPPSAWRPLSTGQCRKMLESGVIELGAHTHTHRHFLGRGGEFVNDMRLCLDMLRDRLGVERPAFSFPYGQWNRELVDEARQINVSCALTVLRQRVQMPHDDFLWGRFDVSPSDTPAMLAGTLSGWYPRLATVAREFMRPIAGMVSVAGR